MNNVVQTRLNNSKSYYGEVDLSDYKSRYLQRIMLVNQVTVILVT